MAVVAFAGSAFANNEIVVENLPTEEKVEKVTANDPCVVEIWKKNSEGKLVLFSTHQIRIYPHKSCSEAVAAINKTLNPTPKTN